MRLIKDGGILTDELFRRKQLIENPNGVNKDKKDKSTSAGPGEACKDSISLYAAMNELLFAK